MKKNSLSDQKAIFKSSSTTYYYSSLFFPKDILEKVTTIYGFVRIADDFVDQVPPQVNEFKKIVKQTWQCFDKPFAPQTKNEKIIVDFVDLAKKNGIPKLWVHAFFESMKNDIPSKNKSVSYQNYQDLEKYIYGSAEVIGIMMCKILDLPSEAYVSAKQQGAAMQLINFIRDLNEDCQFGRSYLASFQKNPKHNLCDFKKQPTNNLEFYTFIKSALKKYYLIQKQAEAGYHFIPYRYRVPIVTAAKLYEWTAKKIESNPEIVFEKKVKPSKLLVLATLVKCSILCLKY